MKKEYGQWHRLKKQVNEKTSKKYFRARDIWYCHLGVNVGYEEDGKNQNFERPVIILKKFNNDVCLIIPLSSTKRTGTHYFPFIFGGKPSTAVISQIRLVDKKRLIRKINTINSTNFEMLRQKVRGMI